MRFEKSRSGSWAQGVTCLCLNRHFWGGKLIHDFKKLSKIRRVIETSRIKKKIIKEACFYKWYFLI